MWIDSVGNSQDGEFDIIIGHLQDIIIGRNNSNKYYIHVHVLLSC